MGIKPLPHFENLLHTFAMQYKIKVQGKLETGAVLVWKKNQMYGNAVRRFLEFVRE